MYDVEEVRSAFIRYQSDIGLTDNNDDDFIALKKLKLQKDIEKVTKENTTKDLEIEKLRNTLIDSEEVLKYLIIRKAIEGAILKRILFTQLPIEIPGLSIPKAREKAEFYYNEVMRTVSDTVQLWEKQYKVSNTTLKKQVEDAIVAGDGI